MMGGKRWGVSVSPPATTVQKLEHTLTNIWCSWTHFLLNRTSRGGSRHAHRNTSLSLCLFYLSCDSAPCFLYPCDLSLCFSSQHTHTTFISLSLQSICWINQPWIRHKSGRVGAADLAPCQTAFRLTESIDFPTTEEFALFFCLTSLDEKSQLLQSRHAMMLRIILLCFWLSNSVKVGKQSVKVELPHKNTFQFSNQWNLQKLYFILKFSFFFALKFGISDQI